MNKIHQAKEDLFQHLEMGNCFTWIKWVSDVGYAHGLPCYVVRRHPATALATPLPPRSHPTVACQLALDDDYM